MSIERLSEIQRNISVSKDRKNNFGNYSYRNAEDILKAVKSQLQDGEAILLNNDLVTIANKLFVKSTAVLEFGESHFAANAFAEVAENKKGMDASQITGSAISYGNKYALSNLLGISDGSIDPDATNKHGKDEPEDFASYKFTFGKHDGKSFADIGKDDALNYVGFLYQGAIKKENKEQEQFWMEAHKWIQANM